MSYSFSNNSFGNPDILEANFKQAAEDVKYLNKKPTNDDLLFLYGLFKQASFGDINIGCPLINLKERAKWTAWNNNKGLDQNKAKNMYIEFVERLKEKYDYTKLF
jgi:diazepam-binding inhibitor (GABA receptor modulating acyl-CoA-binding protein)